MRLWPFGRRAVVSQIRDTEGVPALPVPHLRAVPSRIRDALHALSPRLEVRWAPKRAEWQVLLYTPWAPRRQVGRRRRLANRTIGSAGRSRTEQAVLMSHGWAVLTRTPTRQLTWAILAQARAAWMATPVHVERARQAQEQYTDTLAADRQAARSAHVRDMAGDVYRRTIKAQVMGRPIREAP